MNFAPSPAFVPTGQMVSLVESVLKNIPTGEADKIRLRTTNLLRDYRPTKSNLSVAEQRALKELKKNDNLLILPADKGRATVIMDREKYEDKLLTMLADTATYEKLKRDPAPALERRMNSILLALNRKGALHKKLYEKLRSSVGRNPLLYGLPKVHKPQIPLLPIVSFLQSPTYELSKHLSHLLSPLIGHSSSAVRNSNEFARFIIEQSIEEDEVLVSFDVVSLFTNIQTNLAVEIARRRLENDNTLEERTGMDVEEIVSLLELCLNATYFTTIDNVLEQPWVLRFQ